MMNFSEGLIVKKFKTNGMNVVFRYPKKNDVKDCLECVNSLVREEARILIVKEMSMNKEKSWLKGVIKNVIKDKNIHVFVEIEGRVIGTGQISRRIIPPSATDHVGEIGFGIMKKYRSMGIGEKLVKTLIELGKKEWKIKLVRSGYFSDNLASKRLHKKLGFRVLGKIPEGGKIGGKYLDEILVVKKI